MPFITYVRAFSPMKGRTMSVAIMLSLFWAQSAAAVDSPSMSNIENTPALPTDSQTIADNKIEMPRRFAVTEEQKSKFVSEVKDLSRQIKTDPTNSKARLQRSLDCLWLGRYSEARRDCDSVLKTEASNVDALCEKACANYYLRNFSNAIYDCTLAIGCEHDCRSAFHILDLAERAQLLKLEIQYIQNRQ